MKKTVLITGLSLLTITIQSCLNTTINSGNGQNKIIGNGKVITETREVPSFRAIIGDGVFNIILKQGDKEMVQIESDENIIPLVITSSENDTLKIGIKDSTSISKMNKLNVYITITSISFISNEGVGSLTCNDTLNVKELTLRCEGAGNTSLLLNTDKLSINSEIVGTLSLAGNSTESAINHEGVGAIKAFDLKSKKLSLVAEGVGSAEIFASEELSIDASGVGNVEYKGGAAKKEIKNDGVGKVICLDCK